MMQRTYWVMRSSSGWAPHHGLVAVGEGSKAANSQQDDSVGQYDAGAQSRPLHAVVSALRALEVPILPKQRLEGLLVFLVVLKSVDIHGVVDY
jgi:hypothetical protein